MSKSKRALLLDMCWTSPVALKSLLILSWISAELFSLEQNWWKSKRWSVVEMTQGSDVNGLPGKVAILALTPLSPFYFKGISRNRKSKWNCNCMYNCKSKCKYPYKTSPQHRCISTSKKPATKFATGFVQISELIDSNGRWWGWFADPQKNSVNVRLF